MAKMLVVHPGGTLQGESTIPGDKSISHRALILGSLANGTTLIEGLLVSEDCQATLQAMQSLGVHITQSPSKTSLKIAGNGLQGLSAAMQALDCGNSGTSMRLLAGLLAAQPFSSTLVGDASLSKRPMARIVEPLKQMGAAIRGHQHADQITCPLIIEPCQGLQGIHYRMPVASAQVKSCLLIAGLYANSETMISETVTSRDHTERMLQYLGAKLRCEHNQIILQPSSTLTGKLITIPGDISSAAFFIAGASVTVGAHILLKDVGVNATRLGIIHILRAMGADIRLHDERYFGQEPVADIEVKGQALRGIVVPPEWVVSAIDEFPVLFVVAALAKGETCFEGLGELRHKESDRIAMMAAGLEKLGVTLAILQDGINIRGSKIVGGSVDSGGDHRVAMAFAMAALQAEESITIFDADNITTSFPSFCAIANLLGLSVTQHEEDKP